MAKRRGTPSGEPTGTEPGVPAKIRPKYDPIWALVEPFCRKRLNDEYAEVCRHLLGMLARKRPSPLSSGTAAAWAAGVVRTVGQANFLGDATQNPHAKTGEIDAAFGVSQATGAAKAKAIRDLLKLSALDTTLTLPSHLADHPVTRLATMPGLLDVLGVPAPARPAKAIAKADTPHVGSPRLYTLEAFIVGGPMSAAFAKKNPEIARTIQIRGDQTLEDLHEALFAAFDRFDEHMYEFQFGKGPHHPSNKRYALAMAPELGDDTAMTGTVDGTTLDSLGLKLHQAFGYWFDFGDDWWHQINVEAIDDTIPPGTYPRVTGRVGKSPPQYPR